MIPEIAHFSLILALFLAAVQSWPGLLPTSSAISSKLPIPAATAQFFCVSLAFAALITCYVISDFSVLNVAENSHTEKPLIYKITGTWGNHEGSILLWLWVLSLFGFLITSQSFGERENLKTATLSVQGILCLGVCAFILFTSNPFERLFPPPLDGQDLNPLLQDIGLAIHPPMLYLGYVGFSIVFSLAVGALISGKVDSEWARIAQPWILFSWSTLTLGIALGSWWAYRELGWGGFWFWDPVENASLMPWLTGTALLHSNIVLMKRNLMKKWVILLAIITFSMSMIGTFLVRSGALTSVHSFANDPERGLFILIYLIIVTGAALMLYAQRLPMIKSFHATMPVSREGAIVLNNLFMLTAAASILFATLYPMIIDWFNLPPVTIGPSYFNYTILPLLALASFFAAAAPFMHWRNTSLAELAGRLQGVMLFVIAVFSIVWYLHNKASFIAAASLALAAWLGGATLLFWWRIVRGENVIKRIRSVPRTTHGMLLAHLGAAVVIVGITGAALWKHSHEQLITKGQSFTLDGYNFTLENQSNVKGSNYATERAEFTVQKGENRIATLYPEIRSFSVRTMQTTEAAIHSSLFYDIYIVIGKTLNGESTSVRAYVNPFMNILWLGCIFMSLGGILSIRKPLLKDIV